MITLDIIDHHRFLMISDIWTLGCPWLWVTFTCRYQSVLAAVYCLCRHATLLGVMTQRAAEKKPTSVFFNKRSCLAGNYIFFWHFLLFFQKIAGLPCKASWTPNREHGAMFFSILLSQKRPWHSFLMRPVKDVCVRAFKRNVYANTVKVELQNMADREIHLFTSAIPFFTLFPSHSISV